MPHVALGTAHLFALVDAGRSGELLARAWDEGVRRFDTAPCYGHGLSEPALGTFLAGRAGVEQVTTKVGLSPSPADPVVRRAVKAVARRVLPAAVARRLRGSGARHEPGRFAPDRVRSGAERSVRRLGRVDRFLLHEVQPDEVDEALVAELEHLVGSGVVGAVGVATQNHLTADVLHRLGEVATVVHLAAGPFAPPVPLPAHVTTRVGHGLLGAGGADLTRLRQTLRLDVAARDQWEAAVLGTPFAGDDGLAEALLARAQRLDLTDVVVASSRPDRLARAHALASGAVALPDPVADALDALVDAAEPVAA